MSTLQVPPVLDPMPLRRLAQSLGADGPALVAELLTVFAADGPVTLAALTAAAETRDLPAARRAAHTLKSNAATLGARRLETACRAAELCAAAGDSADLTSAVAAVVHELGQAAQALSSLSPG